MSFGLKNAPPTYQRAVSMAFKEYFGIFMKLFLDNFNVFNDQNTHLQKLHLCFDKCHKFSISLNPDKCMFLVYSGIILRYIVSQECKLLNPKKIGNCQHATTQKLQRTYKCSTKWFNFTNVSFKTLHSSWHPSPNYCGKLKPLNG
jgi:hypothetical protein